MGGESRRRADRKDNKVMILNYYSIELKSRKAFLSSSSAFCEESAKRTCIFAARGKECPKVQMDFRAIQFAISLVAVSTYKIFFFAAIQVVI